MGYKCKPNCTCKRHHVAPAGHVPHGIKIDEAHEAVTRAIRDGKLVRPECCDECGKTTSSLYAHHEDYDKQLEIEWLCPPCHARRHPDRRKHREIELQATYERGVVAAHELLDSLVS